MVTGSAGYVGSRLVAALVRAGHEVLATARDSDRLAQFDWAPRAGCAELDVDDAESCRAALTGGVDVAYYLVHAIGQSDYARRDAHRARTFATAARAAGVRRVVYLGGLVPPDEKLSEHLRSRAEVGDVLTEHGPDVVWLRAAVILGAGSASYELTRYLADWLPVVPLPPWMATAVQPVAVDDVLRYLMAAADPAQLPPGHYDLGGPNRLVYHELLRRYTHTARLRRVWLPLPDVATSAAAWVVARLTPLPPELVADLVLSLTNTMIADDDPIRGFVPDPPAGRTSVADALARARIGAHLRADRLPGVYANPDPLRLCRTDASWARRR